MSSDMERIISTKITAGLIIRTTYDQLELLKTLILTQLDPETTKIIYQRTSPGTLYIVGSSDAKVNGKSEGVKDVE